MGPLAGLGRRWLSGIFEARERAVKNHARALEDRPLSPEARARAITNYDKGLRERFGQAGERECDKRMQRPFHTLTATPGQLELVARGAVHGIEDVLLSVVSGGAVDYGLKQVFGDTGQVLHGGHGHNLLAGQV